jgi:23S rRNA (cytidine1920-2'-O)/16S rRNA (cytidine1409-2'-O)-methyltransferase
MAKKKRLDQLLVEKKTVRSRSHARSLIMSGRVLVDNQPVDKAGTLVRENALISVKNSDLRYVSRGGFKLEGAIKDFNLDVMDQTCLDVGASTGGFTDCLLQNGAKKVFAVDVGYGQLAWKLRTDPRVVTIERTNIRYMKPDALPESVDLVTIDVSFISLKKTVPQVVQFMKKQASIVALIKPQFEVGKGHVGKGGVVRDPLLHSKVIRELTDFFHQKGFACESVVPSPLRGPKGNKEFFILLKSSV